MHTKVLSHYLLPLNSKWNDNENKEQVCKTLFLHTLGLKTDCMITSHFRSKMNSNDGPTKTDERGLLQSKKEETS